MGLFTSAAVLPAASSSASVTGDGAPEQPAIAVARTPRPAARVWGRRALATFATLELAWLLWPSPFGGRTSYVAVRGTSMEPGYHTGDFILARKADDYRVGDIVVYPADEPGLHGARVIHRVTFVDSQGRLTTQGDNRDRPDPWHPTADEVDGKAVVHVPWVGRYLFLFRGRGALGALLGAGLIYFLWPARHDEDDEDAGPLPTFGEGAFGHPLWPAFAGRTDGSEIEPGLAHGGLLLG